MEGIADRRSVIHLGDAKGEEKGEVEVIFCFPSVDNVSEAEEFKR